MGGLPPATALTALPKERSLAEQLAVAWRTTTERAAGAAPPPGRDWSTLLQHVLAPPTAPRRPLGPLAHSIP